MYGGDASPVAAVARLLLIECSCRRNQADRRENEALAFAVWRQMLLKDAKDEPRIDAAVMGDLRKAIEHIELSWF